MYCNVYDLVLIKRVFSRVFYYQLYSRKNWISYFARAACKSVIFQSIETSHYRSMCGPTAVFVWTNTSGPTDSYMSDGLISVTLLQIVYRVTLSNFLRFCTLVPDEVYNKWTVIFHEIYSIVFHVTLCPYNISIPALWYSSNPQSRHVPIHSLHLYMVLLSGYVPFQAHN